MNLGGWIGTKGTQDHTCITGRHVCEKPTQSTLLPPSPMPSKKTKKKRRFENIAPLYTEDLGTPGIKKKSAMNTGTVLQSSSFHLPLTEEEEHRRHKRMERFGISEKNGQSDRNEPEALSSALSASRTAENTNILRRKSNQSRLVGTSTALEKPYLRLTDFPKSENVRPLKVLIKSLARIKSRFINTEDFNWANEQLKSVRQDITVQRLRNKFVLEVYETHARLLLEHGDLNEFHQCQTMIRNLTSPGTNLEDDDAGGKDDMKVDRFLDFRGEGDGCLQQSEESADEFRAYGILYNLVQKSWGEMTKALTVATDPYETTSTTSSEGERPAVLRGSSVRHALHVVKAVVHDDYPAFFRLYESAPHLSAYLMDFLVRRVRNSAYERIIAAYRPTISVEHLREALFFQDLEETRRFLKKNGAIFIQEQGGPPFWLDCKATFVSSAKQEN